MLASIQYLRALAALLVVFHHGGNHFPGVGMPLRHGFGTAGVDLFFVISGFVMTFTTAGNPYTIGQFMSRRLIRVVPLYWFFTFAMAVLLLLAPRAFRDSHLDLPHVVFSLLFIPHEDPGGTVTPLVKLGWTLEYEMLFYLLFGALMVVRPVLRSVLVTLALVGIAFLVPMLQPPWTPLRFWAKPIILEFALGIAVGHLHVVGWLRRLPAAGACALLVLSVAALAQFGGSDAPANRLFVFGLPSAGLVAAAVALEARRALPRMPLAGFLGDASYSIYLSHLYAIVLLRAGWIYLGLPASGPAPTIVFVALALVAGAAAGSVCYLTVERPSLRALHRVFFGSRSRRLGAVSLDRARGLPGEP